MTLPLIHAINVMDFKNKNWLINTVKNHNKDKKRVKEAIKKVKEAGGFDFAKKKMEDYRLSALNILNTFPINPYRKSLELMLNYVIERKV